MILLLIILDNMLGLPERVHGHIPKPAKYTI